MSVAAWLGMKYLKLSHCLFPHSILGLEEVHEAKKKHPLILACFHQRFFWSIFFFKQLKLASIISAHRDGDIVSRVVERMGCPVVRGSTGRGGLRATLGLVKLIRRGYSVGHLVDGPLGPAFRVQKGVIYIARKTGSPIYPVAISYRYYIQFSSWDRFMIPLPFSPILMVYGSPLHVPMDSSENKQEALRQELEQTMTTMLEKADRYWTLSSRERKNFLKEEKARL